MRPLAPTLSALLVALALAGPAHGDATPLAPSRNDEWSLRPGHSLRIHPTGRASYNARSKNFASADVILIKAYAFADDQTGRETVAELCAEARRGAQVFLEYDVKGTIHSPQRIAGIVLGFRSEVPDHLRPLIEAGAYLIPTNKPTIRAPVLGRDHDKFIVTWKRGEPARVIMGGMNVGDEYKWSGPWSNRRVPALAFRDTDVELMGPETGHVVLRFLEAAVRAKTPALAALRKTALELLSSPDALTTGRHLPRAAARFVSNDPKDGKQRRNIERLYEQLIEDTPAGETITLSNAYTLFTKRMVNAVMRATHRGVRFKLLLNSIDAPEWQAHAVALAFRDQLRGLLRKVPEGSIEADEFLGNAKRNEGAIHHKIAKFGEHGKVLVGSAGLDSLSAIYNSETVVVGKHPSLVRQFDALMGRAMREGKIRRIDREALRRDSLGVKIKGFLYHRVVGRFL